MGLSQFLERQEVDRQARAAEIASQPESFNLADFIGPYRVGPGDVFTISLVGADGSPLFPALTIRVDRHGFVDLPVVGKLGVADQALDDVEDTILAAYVPAVYREAACHVTVQEEAPTRVLVTGAVATPGLVQLRRTERNLVFAIAMAGGVSDLASGQATLKRIRRPHDEVTLNLRDPLQVKAALTIDPLDDGDMIHVEAAVPNMIYVGGLVNAGGAQHDPAGTRVTILQALANAQG
ncbi:MAG: polysaccharide biosynthesis/export family protein, partial [Phycisphaerae bacterium]